PDYDAKTIRAQLLEAELKKSKPAEASDVSPATPAPLTESPLALRITPSGPAGLGKITSGITGWLQKWMTSAGNMPGEAFTLDRKRKSDIAKNEKQLTYETTAIRDALLKTSGSATLSPAGVDTLNAAIRSDPAAFASLHPEVRAAVESARKHLDSLSRRAIDNGLAADDLEVTFDANMGVH